MYEYTDREFEFDALQEWISLVSWNQYIYQYSNQYMN